MQSSRRHILIQDPGEWNRAFQITAETSHFMHGLTPEWDNLVGGDRMAILTGGPGGMMDDLRAAVVAAYRKMQGDRLTYYEDSFGW